MSRTSDVITKAQDTPWLLTPAERVFGGLAGPGRSAADLHAEALAGGHPCDCAACAPELYPPHPHPDTARLDWLATCKPFRVVPSATGVLLKLPWGHVGAPTLRGAIDKAMGATGHGG